MSAATTTDPAMRPYRGRLAPSPTGYLHLGHARTFWMAQQRAQGFGGTLVLRNEDLDRARCKKEFVTAMTDDLRWFGFQWQEGPDCGGPFGPYNQSSRFDFYRAALEGLKSGGFVYPCTCSRKDILNALSAPHDGDEEPIYPGTCRSSRQSEIANRKSNWRFRVPDGEIISFVDGCQGEQRFIAGRDFGDFIIWRHDDVPAYQLAVVVDDDAMQITEVVRGTDLLVSTARQLLLYRALGFEPPAFYHCPLMTDENGLRLAKRHDALSLRALRERGADPERIRQELKDDIKGFLDRGDWNYYGVIGNSKSLGQYRTETCRTLFKWLNRRRQKRSYPWRAFNRLLQRFAVPMPRIVEAVKEKLGLKGKPGWTAQQARGVNLLGAQYVASRA